MYPIQRFFFYKPLSTFLQCFVSESGSSIRSESRALMTKNLKICLQLENFLTIFLSKITIYLSLGLHKATGEAFSPQKRTPGLQNMNFCNFFLFLRVIFALLDPDPDSECGSETLLFGQCFLSSHAFPALSWISTHPPHTHLKY
jgi:hypothetical protein